MKIIRFYNPIEKEVSFGGLIGEDVIDIGDNPLSAVLAGEKIAKVGDLQLIPPCSPTKIVAAAMNYTDKSDLDPNMTEPVIFLKSPTSLCGPTDDVVSVFSGQLHWGEPEVAVVVKKRLFRPNRDEIQEAVFGYTSANDITAKNVDELDHHLARSKAADSFCPLGHYIDTEYDFRNKELRGYHGDHLLFKGNTKDFFWNPHELIYQVAQYMTLNPWDLILTGSPDVVGGVEGLTFLQNNDLYEVQIEGLPKLRNRFRLLE